MSKRVDYQYQTLNTPNPIARFAHKQRHEFSLKGAAQGLNVRGVVLDYGCGKGDFLNALAEIRPDLALYGFDPSSNHTPEKYSLVEDMESVKTASVDLLCCFETLEHLYAEEISHFLGRAVRILKDEGEALISVPIIGGPPLLLKELNRMFLFQRRSDYTFLELFAASFLGVPAARPENVKTTHKGLDFQAFEKQLVANFSILETNYSPFPRVPWWLNSQVFYLLQKRP